VVANVALLLLLTQQPAALVPAREQAQLHVVMGNDALLAGEAARAIAEYTQAHRLFPSARILGNLGQAFERTGQPAQALWCYEEFLKAHQHADASGDPKLLRGLAFARRRRAVLAEQVTAEKPTEINEAGEPDFIAAAPPRVPLPVPARPVSAPPPLAVPAAVADVHPTPPSRKTKWIIAGAVLVTGAAATFFLVRALRPDCPYSTCVPSD
jgi:hypothetical protein